MLSYTNWRSNEFTYESLNHRELYGRKKRQRANGTGMSLIPVLYKRMNAFETTSQCGDRESRRLKELSDSHPGHTDVGQGNGLLRAEQINSTGAVRTGPTKRMRKFQGRRTCSVCETSRELRVEVRLGRLRRLRTKYLRTIRQVS